MDIYDDLVNYINLSGVRSTGLTASASLGKYVAQTLIELGMPVDFNTSFDPIRKGIPRFHEMNQAQQDELIAQNPLFGRVVCRCETITEGEIVEAIHRPIPARSMDAVKRRLRAGMGRCHCCKKTGGPAAYWSLNGTPLWVVFYSNASTPVLA